MGKRSSEVDLQCCQVNISLEMDFQPFICSDQRGILYPFNPFYNTNPSRTKMMSKEELRVMENSKELWDKEPTDNGQRSTRLNAEEGYTCNFKNFFTKKKDL